MKRLEMEDASIAYADDGHGDAVLLLHGSFSPDWFAPVASLLTRDDYRVLRMHRAGYGDSKDLTEGAAVDAHAEHAAEVLRASDVRRAHVVGHSSGASLALQLAYAHPDLVASLVLLETAFPYVSDEPRNPAMPRAVEAAGTGAYEQAFDLFLSWVGGPDFRQVFVRELGEDGLRTAIRGSEYFFTAEAPAFADWSFGPAQLETVDRPVLLVVGGEGERLNTPHRARSARLAASLPHSETLVLPGVTHLMPLEDPVAVATLVGDFVSRHP